MIRFIRSAKAPARGEGGALTLTTLVLGLLVLFVERLPLAYAASIANLLDFVLVGLILLEVLHKVSRSPRGMVRTGAFDIAFLLVFVPLFAWAKYQSLAGLMVQSKAPVVVAVLRSVFAMLRIGSRLRRMAGYVSRISTQPARTVTLSFAGVIVAGAVFLMQPFSTVDGRGLGVLDAVFTATSAVCVTGLIVVDTATVFTLWGRVILLSLIQIGGLGIMILSYFAAFSLRRSLSVDDKMLISYMLNENDVRNLQSSLRRIVVITVSIEAVGAALLFTRFGGGLGDRLMYSAFHAISAFCNAGFALFTDSLSGYRSDLVINMVVAGLIIAGGISFGVLTNAVRVLAGRLDAYGRPEKLSLNSRVVLLATAVLIVGGVVLIYLLEHGNTLRSLDLGTQYLSAFFQSVTLRTAGFNTLPIERLRPVTLLVMMVFMFVGAAAGSTAGGIKVNSAAVIGAYLRAVLRDRQDVVLFRHFIAPEIVTKALMVFVFGITAVSTGAIVLSITERAPMEHLLFEVVSAFGTVGLSAGVTPGLSVVGKLVIVALMFAGRLGPLTLLAAAARQTRRMRIQYPTGNVVIG